VAFASAGESRFVVERWKRGYVSRNGRSAPPDVVHMRKRALAFGVCGR
jgi:hypothetical protein